MYEKRANAPMNHPEKVGGLPRPLRPQARPERNRRRRLLARRSVRTGLAMTGIIGAQRQTPIQVIGLKQQTIQQSLAGMPP